MSDQRIQQLRAEIARILDQRKLYLGPEDSGIRLSIDAQARPLQKELRAICPHAEATTTEETETDYAGLQRVEVVTRCPLCGKVTRVLVRQDEPTEEMITR